VAPSAIKIDKNGGIEPIKIYVYNEISGGGYFEESSINLEENNTFVIKAQDSTGEDVAISKDMSYGQDEIDGSPSDYYGEW
jgi:hypothetical protein